ncbi:MAG: pyrroline-5-carboxylate reductase [Spirochaetae bacterium HGW-Spirochaetae-1]|jgi:pyrroline-5-carboxylate reductase|nr:MAG: pyrroline-5-carboxylate reductase [Spirochaetae bacterium HGW-Spirochaetae-1]
MTIPAGKIIGCIGAGNMGGAILAGLAGTIDTADLLVFDTDDDKSRTLAGTYSITMESSAAQLAKKCHIIILAVKPGIIPEVLRSIKPETDSKIIVSIAAGVTIDSMEKIMGQDAAIVRAMPNTPALVKEAMTVLSPNSRVKTSELETVKTIFEQIGKVLVLPEHLMDAVTGISGSGPAYVFTFIQAMADGAVKMGIPRNEALLLAAQTVYGSAAMLVSQGENPIALRDKVTSPGGTTIEAVHILEEKGFSGTVMSAIEAATKKSQKLGSK